MGHYILQPACIVKFRFGSVTNGCILVHSRKTRGCLSGKELVYDKETVRVMLKFGLPLMPASIIAWLNTSISNLLIKEQLTFTALGVYSSALSIASLY